MEENMEKLQHNIRKYRLANRYSVANVAAFLGVSEILVMKWENGEEVPSVEQLHALSRLFKVDMDKLMSTKVANRWKPVHTFLACLCLLLIGIGYVGVKYALQNEKEQLIQNTNKGVMLYYDEEGPLEIVEDFQDGIDITNEIIVSEEDAVSLSDFQYKFEGDALLIRFTVSSDKFEINRVNLFNPPNGDILMQYNKNNMNGSYVFGVPLDQFNKIELISIALSPEVRVYLFMQEDTIAKMKEAQ